MKLTRHQLEKIKATIDFIIGKYDYFADYAEDLEIAAEDIDEFVESGYEVPHFWFPGEAESTDISTEYFLEIADEIPSIRQASESLVMTDRLRYYIVSVSDIDQYAIQKHDFLKINYDENISLELVSESFIVGLAATASGEYDSDLYGTITPYLAIEVEYKSKEYALPPEIELDLVRSYIFELADSLGVAASFSKIENPLIEEDELDEIVESISLQRLRNIEPFNEGMRLFISAVQIQENELKFLNFYKVLEHFAPIVVNIEANELMRKKLDAPRLNFEDGDFIRSIFTLAKSMKDKFHDEELIKATFLTCFDFVGLFEKLPEQIKSKVRKQISESSLDYSTDKQKISMAANMVAKIVYLTRNKVVHAKSNFNATGNECDASDLETLNGFMKEACSQTIRWYNRQPLHLKRAVVS